MLVLNPIFLIQVLPNARMLEDPDATPAHNESSVNDLQNLYVAVLDSYPGQYGNETHNSTEVSWSSSAILVW